MLYSWLDASVHGVEKPQIGVGAIVVMDDVPGQAGIDFAAMLTTSLVKTRKFDVIERARLKDMFRILILPRSWNWGLNTSIQSSSEVTVI